MNSNKSRTLWQEGNPFSLGLRSHGRFRRVSWWLEPDVSGRSINLIFILQLTFDAWGSLQTFCTNHPVIRRSKSANRRLRLHLCESLKIRTILQLFIKLLGFHGTAGLISIFTTFRPKKQNGAQSFSLSDICSTIMKQDVTSQSKTQHGVGIDL